MTTRAEQSAKISRRDLLSLGAKGAGLLVLAKIGIVCRGDDVLPSDTNAPGKTLSESSIPTLAPEPTSTAEPAPKTTQASTPAETLSPVNCGIFETQYCTGGKFADWIDESTGTSVKVAVFNLPQNTPIFSPFDGQFTGTDGGNPINPNLPSIEVYDENSPKKTDFVLIGNIRIRDGLNIQHDNVKKGDILAYTTDTVDKILGGNLALTFDSFDPEKGTRGTDETMLKELFPSLFEK